MSTVKKTSELPTIDKPSNLLALDASGLTGKSYPPFFAIPNQVNDLDDLINPGVYAVSMENLGHAPAGFRWMFVEVIKIGSDIVQRLTEYSKKKMAVRWRNGGDGKWSAFSILVFQPLT